MAVFTEIIKKLENSLNSPLTYNMNTNQRIEGFQFLSSDRPSVFDVYTLYLGDYVSFRDLEGTCMLLLYQCPDQLLHSEPVNNYTIYVGKTEPMHLANLLQQTLLDAQMLNMKKEEMFHALRSGYGIQRILDTARTYLENPITVCSSSFSILCVSPSTDTHSNITTYHMKRYLSKQALENMQTEHVLDKMQNSHVPFLYRFTDEPDHQYLFCGIRIRRHIVGYICIREQNRSFCDSDLPFLLELSHFLSVEMQKEDFFGQKTGLPYEYFLSDLLEDNFEDETFVKERIEQLGHKFYQNYWVIGFTILRQNTYKMNPNYYIYQIQQIFDSNMAFFYQGLVILLYSSQKTSPLANIDQTRLDYFLEYNHMRMAISYRFENILHASRYYHQVVYLCNQKNRRESENSSDLIETYQGKYLQHLLFSCQPNIVPSTLVHPDIKLLLKYDQQNHTEYIKTLSSYFQMGRNALKAANCLHIHKSTFFYRLGKIAELTDFDLENAKLLFAYEFSLQLVCLEN